MTDNFTYTLQTYVEFKLTTVGRDKNGRAFYLGGMEATPNDMGDFSKQVNKHQESVKEFISKTPGLDKCFFKEDMVKEIVEDGILYPQNPSV